MLFLFFFFFSFKFCFQNDFVLPGTGSPMLVAGAKAIVPSVTKVVSLARERGIFIVWVS
jgi:nicotinamidase-related amidase